MLPVERLVGVGLVVLVAVVVQFVVSLVAAWVVAEVSCAEVVFVVFQ